MAAFAHLLAPGRIGSLELRNRIVMAPMGDRLANDDGTVSDRQLAYLEARARGGAGLLLVGSASISYPVGSYAPCQTAISHDRFVAGLTHLADRVHAHGAALGAQLVHDGANSLLDIADGRPMLVPSIPPRLAPDRLSAMVTETELAAMIRPFTTPTSAMGYREADEEDLAGVIEGFADAAERAATAGFDGVEIHGGHGYLIDAFLSPALNRRTDRWGGDAAGRARLLVEVVRAVRDRVGDRLAVWCRLNAVERFRDGGETPDDLLEVARLAVDADVDAISVSAATDAGAALGVTEAHTPHEPELLVPYAAAVRATTTVPVITVGRIEPERAEQIVADGRADFVAMGRKLLADPDLPAKLAAGRAEHVRPCIYQYRCIGNIFLNEPVACVANPATAHGDAPTLPPAAHPRRFLVVGAGPAGMEAARALHERGHRVVLADGAPRLGGLLVAAGAADPVLSRFADWQATEVADTGVELLLSTWVTAELVREVDVDEVVVATGGIPGRSDAPGAGRAVPVAELAGWLIDDDGSVGPDVVVLGGDKAGLSLAQLLAGRGRRVTVLEASGVLGAVLGPPGRFRVVHETEQCGVALETGATVAEITDSSVRWTRPDGSQVETAAATVITTHLDAESGLADEVGALGLPVHVIGDARQPAGIEGALTDAYALAVAAD
jgi:2,4-dienoyl-CoA reductase (NADPH2)